MNSTLVSPAKALQDMFPTCYVICSKDTKGHVWYWEPSVMDYARGGRWTDVYTSGCAHSSKRKTWALKDSLLNKDASFWEYALEDYEEEADKCRMTQEHLDCLVVRTYVARL
jgi:hypothetical protein